MFSMITLVVAENFPLWLLVKERHYEKVGEDFEQVRESHLN
jgi:hypothetical protein